MNYELIFSIVYLTIGMIYSMHWFPKHHEEELDNIEHMIPAYACIVMLLTSLVWPLLVVESIYNNRIAIKQFLTKKFSEKFGKYKKN